MINLQQINLEFDNHNVSNIICMSLTNCVCNYVSTFKTFTIFSLSGPERYKGMQYFHQIDFVVVT